jgi:hypothetical protein
VQRRLAECRERPCSTLQLIRRDTGAMAAGPVVHLASVQHQDVHGFAVGHTVAVGQYGQGVGPRQHAELV